MIIEFKIYSNGDIYWRKNVKLHRDDGPAIITPNGYKAWYQNDNRHREDGPAAIWADGSKEWWENGLPYRLLTTE